MTFDWKLLLPANNFQALCWCSSLIYIYIYIFRVYSLASNLTLIVLSLSGAMTPTSTKNFCLAFVRQNSLQVVRARSKTFTLAAGARAHNSRMCLSVCVRTLFLSKSWDRKNVRQFVRSFACALARAANSAMRACVYWLRPHSLVRPASSSVHPAAT